MKLSVCIPTYNRSAELAILFKSFLLSKCRDFDCIVIDDGSNDSTKKLIEEYSEGLCIKYIYQKNQGRSIALKNAVLNADGKYCVLMDSDDYFVEGGLDEIFNGIERLESGELPDDVKSLLFGVELVKGQDRNINLPPNTITNFVSVRADLKVKKDLKEVVRTDILKSCLYDVPEGCRRVPTSLLWARVSEKTRCLSISKAVAVKEYLPGGMTDRILTLKTKYSKPMVELYSLLSESKQYDSVLYRMRCRILWARHSWHEGSIKPKKIWQLLVWPFGWMIFLLDKKKLRNAGEK